MLTTGAHVDSSFITILSTFQNPGLQVKYEGAWHPVPNVTNSLVMNVGKLLSQVHIHSIITCPGKKVYRQKAKKADKRAKIFFFKIPHDICSHTSSALDAGAKRTGATCHMAMPKCCYLVKGATRPSHTTNMLTSSNKSTSIHIGPSVFFLTFLSVAPLSVFFGPFVWKPFCLCTLL